MGGVLLAQCAASRKNLPDSLSAPASLLEDSRNEAALALICSLDANDPAPFAAEFPFVPADGDAIGRPRRPSPATRRITPHQTHGRLQRPSREAAGRDSRQSPRQSAGIPARPPRPPPENLHVPSARPQVFRVWLRRRCRRRPSPAPADRPKVGADTEGRH